MDERIHGISGSFEFEVGLFVVVVLVLVFAFAFVFVFVLVFVLVCFIGQNKVKGQSTTTHPLNTLSNGKKGRVTLFLL